MEILQGFNLKNNEIIYVIQLWNFQIRN